MNTTLLTVAAFACATLGVIGGAMLIFDLFLRDRTRIDDRMKAEFRDRARSRAKQSSLFRDLQQMASADESDSPSAKDRLQTLLEQAGLVWRTEQFLSVTAVAAAAGGAACWLLTRSWAGGLAGLLVGGIAPLLYVVTSRQRRILQLSRQLPEAFDAMSRALRAGQTVPAALQIVANDFPLPIREEFAHCYEQQHLGISYEDALRDLGRRTGVTETRILSVALILNRKFGGNLAELLGKLAETMRKKSKFQGKVRALTGEGRMQAAVLIAVPTVAFVALYFMDREYVQVLIEKPRLLLAAFASQIVGAAFIYKIINFKF